MVVEARRRRVAVVVEAHHKRVAAEVVVGEGCQRGIFLVEGNWGCLHRGGGGGGTPWLKLIGGDDDVGGGGGGGGHCPQSQNIYRGRMGKVLSG